MASGQDGDADGPGGGLRADAARNRIRLLAAAREEVRAHGHPPSMAVLARTAGVGVGTAYRHFPTPASLLEALGVDGLQQLVEQVRSAADDPDPASGFRRTVTYIVRGQLRDPGIAAILEAAGNGYDPAPPLAAQLGSTVDHLLRRAREAGAVRADVDADDVRRLLVGVAHGLRPVAGDERLVDLHLDVVLTGLRPAPRRPGGLT